MYRGSGLFDVSPVPAQTVERVFERLQTVPGVLAVGAVSSPPFVGQGFSMPFLIDGTAAFHLRHRRASASRTADGGLLSRSRPVSSTRHGHPAHARARFRFARSRRRTARRRSSATRWPGGSSRTMILSVSTCASISSPTSAPARSWASSATPSSDRSQTTRTTRCLRAARPARTDVRRTVRLPAHRHDVRASHRRRPTERCSPEVKRAVAEDRSHDAGRRCAGPSNRRSTVTCSNCDCRCCCSACSGPWRHCSPAPASTGSLPYSVAQRTREFGRPHGARCYSVERPHDGPPPREPHRHRRPGGRASSPRSS